MTAQIVTVRYHENQWHVRTSPPLLDFWCQLRGSQPVGASRRAMPEVFARNPKLSKGALRRTVNGWFAFLNTIWRDDAASPEKVSGFDPSKPWMLNVAKPGPAAPFFGHRRPSNAPACGQCHDCLRLDNMCPAHRVDG